MGWPELIEHALTSKRWTAAQLAKAAGLSKNSISQIRHGRQEPGPRTQQKLASALGWPRDKFLRVLDGLPPDLPPAVTGDTVARETLYQLWMRLSPERQAQVLVDLAAAVAESKAEP